MSDSNSNPLFSFRMCRRAGPPSRREQSSGFDSRPARDSGFDRPRDGGFGDRPRAGPGFGRDDSIDRPKQAGSDAPPPERRRENFSANKVAPAEDSWRKK